MLAEPCAVVVVLAVLETFVASTLLPSLLGRRKSPIYAVYEGFVVVEVGMVVLEHP